MNVIGNAAAQECGRWLNNRAENSHQPLRRRERAMAKFRDVKTLQKFASVVGATDKGQKELIAIADGYRESEQSWLEVLLDLKRRGLEMGPQLALGDGALGFWKALRQVYPGAREQRCWVHKTGNVLNKLPKGLQKKAKGRLQDIWMAETRKDAESAFDFFLEAYGPKYDKAAACLAKDRDVLLTFYDFPAEHWKHVRTTNPIESTFATVRLRTYRPAICRRCGRHRFVHKAGAFGWQPWPGYIESGKIGRHAWPPARDIAVYRDIFGRWRGRNGPAAWLWRARLKPVRRYWDSARPSLLR